MTTSFRKDLSVPGLINAVRQKISKIEDPRSFRRDPIISITDHLMSGLAIFGLKFPSLLDFDNKRTDLPVIQNLKNLYHINKPPSDTYLRERLDEVNPDELRPVFTKLFSLAQRGKVLEEFEFYDGHVLISGDGTGHFSSNTVCCPQCCKKKHSNGTETYYHQMFGVCIVHPDKSNVIPLCPEVILNQDGDTKNDCERNACKRFLENFRREHPHLKAIITEDGLASNAPNIRMIEEHNLLYILVAKPGDHQLLFDTIESSEETKYYEVTDEGGVLHQFRYINDTPLNKSNLDVKVNFVEYMQTDGKGNEIRFSWVTNIRITDANVFKIMRGGRARWKVENETFNTLKNLGYNFEHNYGHGKKYLSTILCMLMMIAFLIDQLQEICCAVYRRCRTTRRTYYNLWQAMRMLFQYVIFSSWDDFYLTILKEKTLNSS